MKLHRVSIPMTDEERAALVDAAQQSMRDPQQHARFILRAVLLGENATDMNTRRDAKTLTERNVTAGGGINP